LAAAHELRRFGHRCTIYEKRSTLGGLNATGVAPYKMRADKALEEVEWVLGIGGIDVRLNVAVGEHVPLEALEQQHDAIFVGVGLGPDSMMNIPGASLQGVHGAVEWIERMKVQHVALTDVKHCVIVGGGNTAVDAVREARALGIPSVTMVYRGTHNAMPGYEHEWIAALTEGAKVQWQTLPVAFEGDGHVQRVRCTRVDASKKPLADSELTIDADLVLLAIGQSKLGQSLAGLSGLRVDQGRVLTDEHGFTGRRCWFAGGDCVNGGKEVVNAAAEGKAAAGAIHAFLSQNPAGATDAGSSHG
jgi:glutamate synthase (NADPH/NADH) small chain